MYSLFFSSFFSLVCFDAYASDTKHWIPRNTVHNVGFKDNNIYKKFVEKF